MRFYAKRNSLLHKELTERAGFEPAVDFPPHSISSAAPSAARSPLQIGISLRREIRAFSSTRFYRSYSSAPRVRSRLQSMSHLSTDQQDNGDYKDGRQQHDEQVQDGGGPEQKGACEAFFAYGIG